MLINLPISEQGIPSELTAAVLYFPNREDDGDVKGIFSSQSKPSESFDVSV